MHARDDPALLEVAEAISDGTPVDWAKHAGARAELRPKLARLRLLELVAGLHRSPDASGTPAPVRAGADADTVTASGETTEPVAVPMKQWGPLRVSDLLGRGGFGQVYRAFDPALQREVALKLWKPGTERTTHAAKRFLDEARRLARVRHPNVVVVHGADEHEGVPGLWTDLVEGRTLEQCLAEQGPFSAREAALIGIDLCRALAAVHAAGLVHRDIKTSNVMRQTGGDIVLLDFGSVAECVEDGLQTSGTPVTMAPELLLRREAPQVRSDIYSLGVLLYRLTSGHYPVEADSLAELLEKHRRGESVSLRDRRSDLPTEFVQVIQRSLAPDAAARFGSAGEMEAALAASIGATARTASGSSRARPRRGVRAVGLAMAAAMTLLLVGVVLLRQPGTPPTFSVDVSLYRAGKSVEERLFPGALLRPGDALCLDVRGTRPLYYYVLNEDDRGHVFVLFPAGLDLENPLPGGEVRRLPGSSAGRPQYWQVDTAGGRERILIIASRHPLAQLEAAIEALPRAGPGRPVIYPQLPSREIINLVRGIGGMVGADTSSAPGSSGSLGELRRLIPEQDGAASEVWIREIELENPGP